MDKAREVRQMLEGSGIEVLTMKEAGLFGDIDENGSSFAENAFIKARSVRKMIEEQGWQEEMPIVIADDSGLEVDAMDGAPGIYSARFMGEDTSYDIKCGAIIEKLEGLKGAERSARFRCAMAVIYPDGTEKVFEAAMDGEIGFEMKGENGFGYDPILYLPELGVTSAELAPEKKNEISHRGKALRSAVKDILEKLTEIKK